MTDFSTPIKDLDGNDLVDPMTIAGEGTVKVVTLARVAANALVQNYPDEAGLAGDVKVKRFMLALKVTGAGELDLTAEDVAVLKERIAKAYGPLVVGRAWALLDPASVKG